MRHKCFILPTVVARILVLHQASAEVGAHSGLILARVTEHACHVFLFLFISVQNTMTASHGREGNRSELSIVCIATDDELVSGSIFDTLLIRLRHQAGGGAKRL